MSTVKATNLQNASSATINLITDTSGNVTIGGSTGAGSVKSTTTAKAWVYFTYSGSVAISASFNVSSVTRNGTGDFTINFTNAMSSATYAVAGTARISGAGGVLNTRDNTATASAFGILTASNVGTVTDPTWASIVVFGN